jgi:hypothetical protein
MNLDKYFNKTYDEKNYNCLHFAADIWYELTGINLISDINKIINSRLTKSEIKHFEKLNCPQTPCVVFMQRKNCRPHVGIHIDGSIFHLTELGPQYLKIDIVRRGFTKLRYVR